MNISKQNKRFARFLLRGLHVLLLLVLLALAWMPAVPLAAQDVEPADAYQAAISTHLAQELAEASGPVSFLVVLREQPDASRLLGENDLNNAAAPERRAALYTALTAHAERTQAPLRAWLDAAGVPYTPHYLVNMIEVQGDAALAAQLQTWRTVDRLAANPDVQQTHAAPSAPTWKRLAPAEEHLSDTLHSGPVYPLADQ